MFHRVGSLIRSDPAELTQLPGDEVLTREQTAIARPVSAVPGGYILLRDQTVRGWWPR
jgi:hypothetical protein